MNVFVLCFVLPPANSNSGCAKAELYAVYETTDRYYWTELARFNQQEFQKSGTEGECIEAREFIIAAVFSMGSGNLSLSEKIRWIW